MIPPILTLILIYQRMVILFILYPINPEGTVGRISIVLYEKTELWGKPFNVGPAVNSAENEVFPILH
jgi:hypothetical protein